MEEGLSGIPILLPSKYSLFILLHLNPLFSSYLPSCIPSAHLPKPIRPPCRSSIVNLQSRQRARLACLAASRSPARLYPDLLRPQFAHSHLQHSHTLTPRLFASTSFTASRGHTSVLRGSHLQSKAPYLQTSRSFSISGPLLFACLKSLNLLQGPTFRLQPPPSYR